ncbi:MAG TPA: phosphotransferase family protein [Acidimicrobiales bacterium]|nr:phosphotransferase family protein [Acidimicrobiales bacterium]
MGERDAELATGLEALLASRGLDGRVEGLSRLSGGASRETYAFDLVAGDRRRPLILQRVRQGAISTGPGIQGEAALLRAADAQGVPVPTVVADDDGTHVGAPALVAERLEGETIARKLLRDDEWAEARRRLVGQAGAALAAVHRIPIADAPPLRDLDLLEEQRELARTLGPPFPAFELALRWLAANRPPGLDHAVVHGDFRLGNLLVDAEGLRGVLDWEIAHLGDPVEDLGWYCVRAWRFGSPLPAGGTGTREELLAAYEAAGGRPVDPEVLRWWELLGTVRWGLICHVQASAHLGGVVRSMELATIGRRVAENEWDVLGLLPGGPLPVADTPTAPDDVALHGRPTARELVEAVREWIEGDVRDATDGRVAFHTRVAANALHMVERELQLGPEQRRRHADGLATLGCDTDEGLAKRIRSGALDDRAEEVREVLGSMVRAKLEVANPRWLLPD